MAKHSGKSSPTVSSLNESLMRRDLFLSLSFKKKLPLRPANRVFGVQNGIFLSILTYVAFPLVVIAEFTVHDNNNTNVH